MFSTQQLTTYDQNRCPDMIPKSTFLVHFTHIQLSYSLAERRSPPLRYTLSRLEVGDAVGGAPGLLGDRFLRKEARRRDHREARVGELLLLHDAELFRVLRRKAERVEADLARHVARAERGLGLELLAIELAEGNVDAVGLGQADAAAHDDPEPDRELRDLVDRGAAVAREKRVELLLDEEAERSEHADAAMRELGLAVAVNLELGLALEEAGRVPVELAAAEGVEVAREAVRELVLLALAAPEAPELHHWRACARKNLVIHLPDRRRALLRCRAALLHLVPDHAANNRARYRKHGDARPVAGLLLVDRIRRRVRVLLRACVHLLAC